MTDSNAAKYVYVQIPFKVQGDLIEAAKNAIADFVSEVSVAEPRTRWYYSFQDSHDPARFVHYMCFEDEAAEQTHRQTPHVTRFVETLYPMCIEEPQPQRLDLVIESRDHLVD